MASEEPPSPASISKRRRSADDDHGAETSSKRRKHHHRHHHNRCHRHHSRNGREGGERVEEVVDAPAAEADAEITFSLLPKPVDDEREEGEILEEDEERADLDGGKFDGFEIGGGSYAQSGEIKPYGVDVYSNLIMSGMKDASSGKSSKVLTHNQNTLGDEKMLDLAPSCENSSWKGAAQREGDMSDGDTLVWKTENISLSDMEKERVHQWEARRRQSKSPEKRHKRTDRNDSKSRVRSRSLVSKQSSLAVKHRTRDDHEKNDSDSDLERLDSRQYVELRAASRRATDKNRSVSPISLQERYRDTRKSPSFIRYHGEDQHRDRPRSCDRTKRQSYEKVSQPSADGDDQVDSLGNMRNDSGWQHRLDRYAASDRACKRELHNERESSSNRRHDDRHGSQERYRERERNNSSIRDRQNMELDKWSCKEREKSSSYSRYVRQEDKQEIRDRGRERERYSSSIRDRVREKPRGVSRGKYVERERLSESRCERDKDGNDRDKNWTRDRDARQMETDRISNRDRHRESRCSKYVEMEHRKDKLQSKEVGSSKDNPEEDREKSIREQEEDNYQERIEQQLAKQGEEDVDKIKEESRKRRQAILEKYRQRQLQQVESSSDNVNVEKTTSDKENLRGLHNTSVDDKANNEELENRHGSEDVYDVDPSFMVGKSPVQNGDSAKKNTNNAGELGEGTPKSERSADMFSDDIFGESPAGVCKMGKGEGPQIDRSCLHDNWDDAEGYYSYRFGEVLDSRYEVIAAHGKGVFSTVVRARDLKAGKGDPEEVAIKIIRNNETMYKAGQDELVILKKLVGADPEDKRRCVIFLSSFKYRNHLCLVFESLHMNLREVLKKFGRNIGLKLTAVRAYAKQLFIALKHLRNCGVLHCDIKPDNMLVNEAKNVLKLCDFGNAMFAGKNEITPYLVSRFYRAPEIILGLPYDHPMDMWSVGCCLYELYTGKVLFPAASNNDMLRLHMELKGPFPKKLLRKGAFTDQHFDQDLNFHATEEDPVTKKPVMRLLPNIKPKDIGALISGFPGEDPKMLSNFKDLLDRIFVLDPEKRMTVSQALCHPFITGK